MYKIYNITIIIINTSQDKTQIQKIQVIIDKIHSLQSLNLFYFVQIIINKNYF